MMMMMGLSMMERLELSSLVVVQRSLVQQLGRMMELKRMRPIGMGLERLKASTKAKGWFRMERKVLAMGSCSFGMVRP
jgi:hypothetical protein